MKMVRLRLTEYGEDDFKAEYRAYGSHGTISKKYISKAKQREVKEYGYAYVNQPKERMV
jgi:hypothetical protein